MPHRVAKSERNAQRAVETAIYRTMDLYPDALFVCRRECIVFANAACVRLLGASAPDEMVGRTPLDFIHPDSKASVERRIQEHGASGVPSPLLTERLVRLDGASVDVEVAVLPYQEDGERVLHILLRDGVQRKAAESELEESEMQFRTLFEESPLGLCIVSLDLHVRRLNARLCAMLDYPNNALIGRPISEILAPQEMAAGLEMFRRLIYGEITRGTFELRFQTSSGETVWGCLHISMVRDSKQTPRYLMAMIENITERKAAEEVASRNSARLHLYERIVQNIHEALLVTEADPIDPPGPRVVYVNEAFEQMTGYSADEIIGQTPRILQGPKMDRRELDKIRIALHKQEAVHAELVNYRKDGTEFDVELEIVPLHDDTGKTTHLISIERDVTARNRAEQMRREEQERFAKMVETSPGVLCSYRLRPDGTGAFVYASPRLTELFGLRPEEIQEDASPLFALIHRDDIPHVQQTIAVSAATLEPWRNEYRIQHPQHGVRWIEGYLMPTRETDGSILWQGIAIDITERKHEAEILRESQEHLRIAIEAAQLGLWEWNLKTNTLVWSGNNERLFGMPPGEFDGKFETFLQCIHPEDRKGVAAARETARNTKSQYRHTYRVIWLDGTIHWLSGSGHFFYDAGGEPTHAAGAIIDVTDRQNLQEERLQMAAITERRAVTMEATRRIVLDILLNRTGAEVLTHIAEAARTLVQARYAALSVVDSNGICLQDFITVGLPAEQEHAIGSLPAGESLLRRMLTRTEPMRIETPETHPASLGFPPGYPQVESFLGVPIRSGSKVLGAFYLTNREDGAPFTDGDEEAIAALADYAAVAIHHQQLLHQQNLLMHRFINTLEDERRSVAYELHDGLTQYVMTSYLVLSTFAAEHCESTQAPMPEKLAKGLEYMQQAVLEARRMVNGLRSLSLDDLGLVGALERLVEEEKERAGWDTIAFEHNLEEMRFDTALETAAYRVAQEALTNARKYAETSRVRVTLLRRTGALPDREYLVLEVYDWGKGFDIEKTRESYEHLGMHSMEERVRLMQGTFEIVSAPGQGALVHAVFPLPIRQEPLPPPS